MERNKDFILSVSCTTRKPREGEVHGVHYFFLSREEFEQNIQDDKFLEYAQFAENYYGTKKKYVKQKMDEGFNVLLEIDTQGALQVKEKMPESILIFIAPPGVNIITGDISGGLLELEHRLRGRHTEDEATIQKRLSQVKIELERSKKYDYTVINDDVDRAVGEIENIVRANVTK
jgi:guanylate kinase